MKLIINFFIFFTFLLIINSCGNNSKKSTNVVAQSQSIEEIIKRSGTKIPTTTARQRAKALDDAQNRLKTGGGLFGKKPMEINDLFKNSENDNKQSVASIGLPINAILWKSSLEVVSFMPISSADPFAGIIITDWYSLVDNSKERCKLNVFIKGVELNTENLQVNTFCQILNDNSWVDGGNMKEQSRKIEDAIFNKAKKIKLSLN